MHSVGSVSFESLLAKARNVEEMNFAVSCIKNACVAEGKTPEEAHQATWSSALSIDIHNPLLSFEQIELLVKCGVPFDTLAYFSGKYSSKVRLLPVSFLKRHDHIFERENLVRMFLKICLDGTYGDRSGQAMAHVSTTDDDLPLPPELLVGAAIINSRRLCRIRGGDVRSFEVIELWAKDIGRYLAYDTYKAARQIAAEPEGLTFTDILPYMMFAALYRDTERLEALFSMAFACERTEKIHCTGVWNSSEKTLRVQRLSTLLGIILAVDSFEMFTLFFQYTKRFALIYDCTMTSPIGEQYLRRCMNFLRRIVEDAVFQVDLSEENKTIIFRLTQLFNHAFTLLTPYHLMHYSTADPDGTREEPVVVHSKTVLIIKVDRTHEELLCDHLFVAKHSPMHKVLAHMITYMDRVYPGALPPELKAECLAGDQPSSKYSVVFEVLSGHPTEYNTSDVFKEAAGTGLDLLGLHP